MKNVILFTTMLFFAGATACAQQAPPTYGTLAAEADSLLAQKQYLPAAQAYSAAFKSFGWKGYSPHRYSAAQSWALAGAADSAFFNLERIATKANFSDFKTLEQDTAFAGLRQDARWPELLRTVKKNSGVDEATFDAQLVQYIDSLATEDQRWRHLNRELGNSPKADPARQAQAIEMMRQTDSLNYGALTRIVDRYGFPGYDLLGNDGSNHFWLLVQHQDRHPDFQERVLKLMEVAVKQDKASAKDYAYLVDRVAVNTGKLQVYGTQMTLNADRSSFEPKPCVDPERLDERRASVGLGTMASYIDIMNHNYSGQLKRKD